MPKYRMLVTDITNYGDLRCVAGWDLDREKMIRPEPFARGFWPSNYVSPAGPFGIGQVVNFEGSKPSPTTEYPHLTEDRVVTGKISLQPVLAERARKDLLKAAAFDSLDSLFDQNLIVDGTKAYVPVGSKCSSLGGLLVPSGGVILEPYENFNGKRRIRLRFSDNDVSLAPNFTSTKGYEADATGHLRDINLRIADSSNLLLRIGLARGFDAFPNRCYLQVNGLCFLD